MATIDHESHRRNSANEKARNILLVRQLTESWLNVTYVGETETRIWLEANLTLGQLTAALT